MLDAKLLRKDIDTIANALKKRHFILDVDAFKALEDARKNSDVQTQQLQSDRKKASKKVGELIKSGLSVDAAKAEVADILDKIDQQLTDQRQLNREANDAIDDFLLGIPNVPDGAVPDGKNESDNLEVARVGTPKSFDFEVRDHVDLGADLQGLDFDLATKLTGSRFVVMRKGIARLHRALSQFMLDTHTEQHGYEEVNVPFIVNADSLKGTGQLPKFAEDLFQLHHEGQDYYLIPTAESPLTNIVRDMIIDTDNAQGLTLPVKLVGHTPCFRSEAGSYGRDVRGMIRQHQFEKVELVWVVEPESSSDALEQLCQDAEKILQLLELPYRKVLLCGGDMGASAAKTYDLEVWLPSQQTYREISSCSNTRDYQARRMMARYRNAEGKPALVHTLNGSGLAVGRTLLAVMENYQQKDGTILIPKKLIPYMGGKTVIGHE